MIVPPLMALSGSDKFKVRKELDEVLSHAIKSKWRVVYAQSMGELRPILDGALWDLNDVLVIVTTSDIDPDLFRKQQADTKSLVRVCWMPDGKAPKFISEVKYHGKFDLPKPWEMEDTAKEFLKKAFAGITISGPLVEGIVHLLGTDRFLLDREVWKLRLLLERQKRTSLTSEDLKFLKSCPFTTVTGLSLVNSLGLKNKDQTHRTLTLLKGQPIQPLLGLLIKNLRQWVVIKSMMGQDVQAIATAVGVPLFILQRDILPLVTRWSLGELHELFRHVLEVKRGSVTGAVDPWSHLEAVLQIALSKATS